MSMTGGQGTLPAEMTTFDPLAYWEERLEGTSGAAGVGCFGLSDGYNRWLHRVKARALRVAIRSIPWQWEDKWVLDIGSGTGFCLGLWKQAGVGQIKGSDFTRQSVRRLRARWPDVEVARMDITEKDIPLTGPFDAVSAVDVLFHITHDDRYRRAAANVGRLLRPGGYFLFTENFLHGKEERNGHMASRDIRDIEVALRRAGLKPINRWAVFVLMNRPIDSSSRFREEVWRRVERLARNEFSGWLTGASLYPLELALLRGLVEGPSTELMLCRNTVADTAS
jgi:SAM-dependent methyltransferase